VTPAQAERNLLDAQLASDEGALSHIQARLSPKPGFAKPSPRRSKPRTVSPAPPPQAMSAAVAEVDDVAAVALSMARLSVLDDAEARLEALRQRQRAMVDSLLIQARLSLRSMVA
jgi:hypothetical protein